MPLNAKPPRAWCGLLIVLLILGLVILALIFIAKVRIARSPEPAPPSFLYARELSGTALKVRDSFSAPLSP